jgi:hypothetical protein
MMGWFSKKPPWEMTYAENIYHGLVAHNDFGDMTALKLRIPTTTHRAYQNKILLQREMICFVALMEAAKPGTQLQPVMLAFGNLLVSKISARSLQMNRDQLAEHALRDVEKMISDPFPWAQHWLAEFRDDPNDNYMVALFADHCLRLYNAYKQGIEETKPK